MMALLARITLSLAMLLQGAGAIAFEIGMASQPHCHATGSQGKQGKMPCCHCDECTLPACASGCAMNACAFIASADFAAVVPLGDSSSLRARVADLRSTDRHPPLRPPIA